ncbi:MAG TPA: DUF4062 domain-containing protein [Blastocatellia bacterium]|nr:DUF4062 domain-containing protein [Blastocatellia bacterium]
MARIYISSTYSDLKEYREAACEALRRMGHMVAAMEDYIATDQRPLDKCLADVAACDLYVGFFAWRYGFVPKSGDPEGRSITELEFRHAVKNGLPCLIFLSAEDHPWPPSLMEKGEGADRLHALRKELSEEYLVSFFRSKEELVKQVERAVRSWADKARRSVAGTDARGRQPNLGYLVSKTCDRARQVNEFKSFFTSSFKRQPGSPQLFVIHGEERECHDSLVDRLFHTEISGFAERKWGGQKGVAALKRMGWVYDGEPEELQQQLLVMLFAEFDPAYMEDDLSVEALARLASSGRSPLIVLQHRIHASRWGKDTGEVIRWYLEYWSGVKALARAPQFLIFLNVIYPKGQSAGWLKGWLAKRRFDKAQIERELREIVASYRETCPGMMFRELAAVKQDEVQDWFSLNNIHTEKLRHEFLERVFTSGDGQTVEQICMAEVEHELERLVELMHRDLIRTRGYL